MNGIFDSHAHYDDERFDADRDELLESIHREGVEYIMTIGADLPTSYAARELAERYDFVYFAAGIHPEQAGDAPENYLEELKALAAHPKCRAIGEIGLDYYWAENPPKERQMELFRQQVRSQQLFVLLYVLYFLFHLKKVIIVKLQNINY